MATTAVGVLSVQGAHPLSGEGLGESDTVAAGLADVGVVEQPVNGGRGQRFGHEFVEPGGVQVRADGDGPFLVGGIHQAVQAFGGIVGHRKEADVVDDDEVGAQDAGCLLYTSRCV